MSISKLFWLLILALGTFLQAEEWEHLKDCELVPSFLNDGDSFLIRHGDKESIFQLYFVDAPESSEISSALVTKQAAYYNISRKRTTAAGNYATKFSARFLQGKFSVYTRWNDSGGKLKRYAAILVKDGRSLSMELSENGLGTSNEFDTEGEWNGQSIKAIKEKLGEAENRAKAKKLGAWSPESQSFPSIGANLEGLPEEERVNLNTSSAKELETLPAIGETLAGRIIEGRPWHRIDDIRKVKGIGDQTMLKLRPLVTVVYPDAPTGTADYFRQNRTRWMGRRVHVSIDTVIDQNWPAPDGFVVVLALTSKNGKPGGAIPIFFPQDRLENVLRYYGNDSAKAETTAIFYRYNGEDVLVKK